MQQNKLPIFKFEVNESEHNILDISDYRVGYFIAKNRSKGSVNEDTLFLNANKDSLIFGVSDGAGGHPKGLEASKLVSSTIVNSDISEVLSHPVEICDLANENVKGLKVGARSTLVLCSIDSESYFRSFSVGDSEVIYWNSAGGEVYSNTPSSVIGYRIEAGILEQEDSLDDPERNIVNNLMGDEFLKIEAMNKIEIKKGNSILVGTDGLFDNISHSELCEIAGKGSFDNSFNELISACLEQKEDRWKKDDDIAFIFVRRMRNPTD